MNLNNGIKIHCRSLPHSHFAVHDIRKVKVGQQVTHMEERFPIFFYDAMVTGNKWEQRVIPQLLKTLHLIFRKLLQDGALIRCFEVTWDQIEANYWGNSRGYQFICCSSPSPWWPLFFLFLFLVTVQWFTCTLYTDSEEDREKNTLDCPVRVSETECDGAEQCNLNRSYLYAQRVEPSLVFFSE